MAKVECAGKTDVGRRRSNNEDAIVLRPDLGFMALADGMGGAASGELASGIFVEAALQVFSDTYQQTDRVVPERLQRAFLLANERIWKNALEIPEHKGMGCTAEILAFDGESYVIGHVGDSRTYLFRNSNLRQITKDHSVVQDQVDKGLLTPEEARTHSLRNVIMRAVGVHETLAVDMIRGRSQPGDIYLLCSDGLTDMLRDETVSDILTGGLSMEQTADRLVESANLAGGIDNISVVLCKVT